MHWTDALDRCYNSYDIEKATTAAGNNAAASSGPVERAPQGESLTVEVGMAPAAASGASASARQAGRGNTRNAFDW